MKSSLFQRDPVLVPAWVAKQLTRLSLPLSVLLDLDRVRSVLSQEDQVILYQLNKQPFLVLGIPHIRMGLFEYWRRFPEALRRVEELVDLYPGQENARLYYAAGPWRQGVDSDEDTALEIQMANGCIPFDVREDNAGLDAASVPFAIVQPGFFGGPSTNAFQQALRRTLLKQSYASRPYEAVAEDSVFSRYLEEL